MCIFGVSGNFTETTETITRKNMSYSKKINLFANRYKFLLVFLTLISTVIIIKKDYIEATFLSSSNQKNNLDLYKENTNFQINYNAIATYTIIEAKYKSNLEFSDHQYPESINQKLILNDILNDYLNFGPTLPMKNDCEMDNICLYVLHLKQTNTVIARNVILEYKEVKKVGGFKSTKIDFLNSLITLKGETKQVNLGDFEKDKGIIFPTLYIIFNGKQEDFNCNLENYDYTSDKVIIPLKIYYTNDLTGEKQSIEIRKMLDYAEAGLYNVFGRG